MDTKKETQTAFKNLSQLILLGSYSGQFSKLVAESIAFIDAIVESMQPEVDAEEAAKTELEKKETLEIVKPETVN